MNYMDLTVWGKVLEFLELYNVMELCVFQNELFILGYKPRIPPEQ